MGDALVSANGTNVPSENVRKPKPGFKDVFESFFGRPIYSDNPSLALKLNHRGLQLFDFPVFSNDKDFVKEVESFLGSDKVDVLRLEFFDFGGRNYKNVRYKDSLKNVISYIGTDYGPGGAHPGWDHSMDGIYVYKGYLPLHGKIYGIMPMDGEKKIGSIILKPVIEKKALTP
jgi:hypothetical protein